MYTYLVMFDCLVVAEPYFEYIKADTVNECWLKAFEISRSRRELSEGSFEIYRLMTEEDYGEWDGLWHEEVDGR